MKDYKLKFGKRLQEIRKMRKLTQLMLAEKVEVDAKYISRIESGISSPSFEMITKFASALEVQPELLFKIVLPAVFPGIASGLHIALGTAWIFLVTGEMVGSQTGLGFLIIDMRNNLRNDLLMVAILTIGFVGLLLDWGVSLIEKWIYKRWGIEK